MHKIDFSQAVVHKFGGSNLTSATQYQECIQRLTSAPTIIIISATSGTTKILQGCLEAAKKAKDFKTELQACVNKHIDWVSNLFSGEAKQFLCDIIYRDAQNMHDTLHAVALVGDYSTQARDMLLSFGERWSAQILAALINQSRPTTYIDASKLLFTYEKRSQVWIDWEKSELAWQSITREDPNDCFVITGFIASNEENQLITLGSNGSDYSATVMAKMINAKKLIIWKDVDGIYTADPRRVRSAFPISEISYESALELAYFGASVLHPRAIAPLMAARIPVTIKNFGHPEHPGTTICANPHVQANLIQGLTSIDNIAVITIEGSGMIGVTGTAARVFSTMQHENISVILISQASSEHSICFAIENTQARRAVKVLQEEFEFELVQNLIEKIKADTDCAILAAVGDGMVGTIGISGKLFNTLAKAGVNIRAIAQGSSERNISLVVSQQDIYRALRAVHAGFYLSKKTISVGLIGPGTVGKTLLSQIQHELEHLRERYQVNIWVRGIANSKQMLLSHEEIDLTTWPEQLAHNAIPVELNQFADFIVADDIPHAVIIDCTANQVVADHYPDFITKGANVITPNKRAGSGDIQKYYALKKLCQQKQKQFLYETTVCAGLPVMTTIQDILQTGDEIIEIQGIVSGTLGYIFYQARTGMPFSQIIQQAKAAGYTEPDPRDDLSGMDVARKIVILAREMGLDAQLDQVNVESLVPPALRNVSMEEFMQKLPEYDQTTKDHLATLARKDEIVAYVGSIHQSGKIDVGIKAFPKTHPFANMQGTDNMLVFRTNRYNTNPLIIQGPGAGAEVTAAGVFADLLRCVAMTTE